MGPPSGEGGDPTGESELTVSSGWGLPDLGQELGSSGPMSRSDVCSVRLWWFGEGRLGMAWVGKWPQTTGRASRCRATRLLLPRHLREWVGNQVIQKRAL